ncbi:hypothetical protein H0H93_011705 [Arthromyces matolae]|nr:hypothetical protein H0H93_011705 [Arthromyces matolae]
MEVATRNSQFCAREDSEAPFFSLQDGADAIIALVESERKDAAAASHQRYLQLEQHFASYRQNASMVIAAEHQRFNDAQQELYATQAVLAQHQRNNNHSIDLNIPSANYVNPCQRQITSNELSQQNHHADEISARRRLEEMQSALRDVGISFSSRDNSLIFEAGWAAVLSQLEARDFGVMNAGRLHEVLGQLTYRLQIDRETISQLRQHIINLDAEKMRIVDKYEVQLRQLAKFPVLNESVISQSPSACTNVATESTVTSSAEAINERAFATHNSYPTDVDVGAPNFVRCQCSSEVMIAHSDLHLPNDNPYAGIFNKWT